MDVVRIHRPMIPFDFEIQSVNWNAAHVVLRDLEFQNCSGEYLIRSYGVENTTLSDIRTLDCQADFEVLGIVGGIASLQDTVWERISARQLMVIARWDEVVIHSLYVQSINSTILFELSGNTFESQGTLSHLELNTLISAIELSGHIFTLDHVTVLNPSLSPEQSIFLITCDRLHMSNLSYQEGTGGLMSVKPLVSEIDQFTIVGMDLINVTSSTRSIMELHNAQMGLFTDVNIHQISTPTLVELTHSWLDINASATIVIEEMNVFDSSWNQLIRSTGSEFSLKARDLHIESNVNYKITEVDCAFSLGSEETKRLTTSFTNLQYLSNQRTRSNPHLLVGSVWKTHIDLHRTLVERCLCFSSPVFPVRVGGQSIAVFTTTESWHVGS